MRVVVGRKVKLPSRLFGDDLVWLVIIHKAPDALTCRAQHVMPMYASPPKIHASDRWFKSRLLQRKELRQ